MVVRALLVWKYCVCVCACVLRRQQCRVHAGTTPTPSRNYSSSGIERMSRSLVVSWCVSMCTTLRNQHYPTVVRILFWRKKTTALSIKCCDGTRPASPTTKHGREGRRTRAKRERIMEHDTIVHIHGTIASRTTTTKNKKRNTSYRKWNKLITTTARTIDNPPHSRTNGKCSRTLNLFPQDRQERNYLCCVPRRSSWGHRPLPPKSYHHFEHLLSGTILLAFLYKQ